MSNKCKKILTILFFSIILLIAFSTKSNAANKIKSITMDVFVDNNGTAKITEIWEAELTEGTEGYKPYGNLGKCKISNFSVKDRTGRTYTTLSKWNIKKSFEEKAYKCGINKNGSDIELCWGISNYGENTYTLNYEITNFVNQYKDCQGIYFSLIPKKMTPSPQSVKITIRSNHKFNKENSQIWAFGYPKGDIQFVNGNIVMDSKGKLSSSDYMVALVKIDNGTFNATNKVNKTFDRIYDEAKNGINPAYHPGMIAFYVILAIFGIFGIVLLIYGIVGSIKKAVFQQHNNLIFGKGGLKLPKKKNLPYYRNIPCNGDLLKVYWLNYYYNQNMLESQKKEGLLGAFLLKWLKEGRVDICENSRGEFNIKKKKYAIDLSKMEPNENDLENQLISILLEASGDNEILEPNEFKKWCYDNYKTLKYWFRNVLYHVEKQFVQEKLITVQYSKKMEERFVNPSMKDLAIELFGLKKYLLDYSLIHERNAEEVEIWEDYLIFAQILGIAKKVQKQLQKLYPNFNEFSNTNLNYSNIMVNDFFNSGVHSARRGEEYDRRSRYSSGGGGSSFSGGGSSSSGHTSGGGFR